MQASTRQPRKWTSVEDQTLREEVEAQLIGGGEVKDWCRIATHLPGRTNKDCRKRWHNSVAGGLKKGQWSKSEDTLLARGVEQHGQKWTLVASCVDTRSADREFFLQIEHLTDNPVDSDPECAKRWQQSLDPELDRSEWREDEDKLLIGATQKIGRQWKDIQRDHFPGRSKNCIKNRYTVLVRRYQNLGIVLPSRGSSPSDCSTPGPMSGYSHDDEYLPYAEDVYGNLMPPHTQGASGSSHHSWSSMESEALAWSSPANYELPATATSMDFSHASSSMSNYDFAQPHALNTGVSTSPTHWPWPATSLDAASSMYSRSPISYSNAAYPAPHYDDSTIPRPLMPPSASYSNSPARAAYSSTANATSTSTPLATTWSDQEHITYPDPGLPQNPLYRF